jgi:hypothetical protein
MKNIDVNTWLKKRAQDGKTITSGPKEIKTHSARTQAKNLSSSVHKNFLIQGLY